MYSRALFKRPRDKRDKGDNQCLCGLQRPPSHILQGGQKGTLCLLQSPVRGFVPQCPPPQKVSKANVYEVVPLVPQCPLEDKTELRVIAPTTCPVHGNEATSWNRIDGGVVCGRCHPDPFAMAAKETS